jgi:hypothetical protein
MVQELLALTLVFSAMPGTLKIERMKSVAGMATTQAKRRSYFRIPKKV